LLSDFIDVIVPDTVGEEVERHRPAALKQSGVAYRRVAPIRHSAELDELRRLFALHLGEAQALQLAIDCAADLLLTDDTAARLAASHFAVPVHGTIGILLRSMRRGQRTADQVSAMLSALPTRSSLHVKPALLDDILRAIESNR
jgi:predicted nucleic acid-binding protein